MKDIDDYYELFYPKREIGVSHYPMPSTPVLNTDLSGLDFLKSDNDNGHKGLLLYLHIPFCKRICSFCPYNKIVFEEAKVKRYLEALRNEMKWYGDTKYIAKSKIEAIYVGGGTPSNLDAEQLIWLLDSIKDQFELEQSVEITVEGNPYGFHEDKLLALFEAGVTRISLGIQTFQDDIGKIIELPHTSAEAVQVISRIKQIGFRNLSIDLMYNLPKQTDEQWQEDLAKAVAINIDHITLFHLIMVPETRLFKRFESGELHQGDTREELKRYQFAVEFLTSNGYIQETTYDFALPNKSNLYGEKHFKKGYDILGLGMGAFGEINKRCYINNGNFNEYISAVEDNRLPISLQDIISNEDKQHAVLVMGLRMLEVELSNFQSFKVNPFGIYQEQLLTLTERNLVEITEGKIRLTDKGKMWGNNICKEFYSESYKKTLPAWQRMEQLARKSTFKVTDKKEE